MAITSSNGRLAAPRKRHEIADYLKVGENYGLMGTGFTTINESYGAQEDGKVYVNDKEQSTTVTSYQREFSYNCDLIDSQAAVDALREVGIRGLTGTDAMFEYVRVDLFKPKTTESTNKDFFARHFIVSCIPDSEEGEGAETVTDSGTLKPFGGMEEGWFNVETLAFSADSAAYGTEPTAASTPAAEPETTPATTP